MSRANREKAKTAISTLVSETVETLQEAIYELRDAESYFIEFGDWMDSLKNAEGLIATASRNVQFSNERILLDKVDAP